MKKILYMIIVCGALLELNACSSGSSAPNPTPNPTPTSTVTPTPNPTSNIDIQQGSIQPIMESGTLNLAFSATNCQSITSHGSCSLVLNYSGTNRFIGETIGLTGLSTLYSSTIDSCKPVSTNQYTCTVTLNSLGSVSAATTLTLTVSGNLLPATGLSFIIGGRV